MKKKLVILFTALCGFLNFKAQKLEINWSDKMMYDNKIDGFFDTYLGSNGQYSYAKFSNLALAPKKANKKVKILALDKVTLKKGGELRLYGYEGSGDKEKKDMDYYETIVLEDVLYVIWVKENSKNVEFFAESFSPQLKKISKLKKIYEIAASKKGTDNLILVSNKKIGSKILIGKEFAIQNDNENLKIEYNLLNQDLSVISSKVVTLPITIMKKARRDGSYTDLIASYELGDNGKLYVTDVISITGDDKKKLRKGEASRYPLLIQINMDNGSQTSYSVKFQDKNTFRFSTLVTKAGVALYGFFCDLNKDPKGNDTHGLFYINIDNDFKPKEPRFTYFDKNFLDQLYSADKENQKKGKGRNKDAKKSDDESIDDNYIIEEVREIDNDIVLFCTIMRNWSETTCTTNSQGGTTCVTRYYCGKSNVTAFRMSNTGSLVWASNLDRYMVYSGTSVYDLSVTRDGNNFFVVYGSGYQLNTNSKGKKKRKSGEQMRDRFEYAIFDAKNGQFKKDECQVNKLNATKAERKTVNASNIWEDGDLMYTSFSKTKFKGRVWFSCLFPPLYYCFSLSGNSRKGTGYLGAIKPVK